MEKMRLSVLSFSVVFLLLTHNLHNCNSELITLTILGAVSSIITISQWLAPTPDYSVELNTILKVLLALNQSVPKSASGRNARVRFPIPSERVEAEKNYNKVTERSKKIEEHYYKMEEVYNLFVSQPHSYSWNDIYEQNAKDMLSYSEDFPIALASSIYRSVTDQEDPYSIFNSLQQRFEHGYKDTCFDEGDMQSAQKYILDYLIYVAAAQTKAYMAIKMATSFLHHSKIGNYSSNVDIEKKNLIKHYDSMMIIYQKMIQEASRDIWRCDPRIHVEGITYEKLKRVFKKFVTNEADLEYNNQCSGHCSSYNPRKWSPHQASQLNAVNPGKLWDCKSEWDFDIRRAVEICYSNSNSDRIYDTIKTASSTKLMNIGTKTYGSDKECDGRKGYTEMALKLSGIIDVSQCNVCVCTIDKDEQYNNTDPQHSERFFYAAPVYADVSNKYVLTGVRIVKRDGVIVFDIQQGKMSNVSHIESSSVSWKTIAPEKLHKRHFHIYWSHRNIELVDIDVPPGHVLVGLKFYTFQDRIGLEVLSLPKYFSIDFTRNYSLSDITISRNLNIFTSVLDMADLDLPDPTKESSTVVTNMHLRVSTSSMVTDVGQTTLPFIDIQNVTTTVPSLMVGAGLYYKYSQKPLACAGYLGIKLKANDLS